MSKIIYDGLLGFRNIFFGGGIKRNLKENHMQAKQNNRIIEANPHVFLGLCHLDCHAPTWLLMPRPAGDNCYVIFYESLFG